MISFRRFLVSRSSFTHARSWFGALIFLAASALSAHALTVTVSEDTSTTVTGTGPVIRAASGTGKTLAVNAKSAALLRFALTDSAVVPADLRNGDLTAAVLRLYVVAASAPGDLLVCHITSDWTATPDTASVAAPTIDTAHPIATIPAAQLRNRSFISADVTAAIQDALAGTNFGLAMVATGAAKVTLASEEGPADGSPPQIDLEFTPSEGTVALTNLDLPAPTATSGIIYSGDETLIQGFGGDDFFAGRSAGNLTLSGVLGLGRDTGIGTLALHSLTSGINNTAVGVESLSSDTTGTLNTAIGAQALVSNTTADDNTAVGAGVLFANTTGTRLTAVGTDALAASVTASDDTAVGYRALASDTTGHDNTAVGAIALGQVRDGQGNTMIGSGAGQSITGASRCVAIGANALALVKGSTALNSGTENIAIGYNAGGNISDAGGGGDGNIMIGNPGKTNDTGFIRIGDFDKNATFIGGIATAQIDGDPVYVTGEGQLGQLSSSRRFKHDIVPMQDASDVIFSLRPVRFRYNDNIDPHGNERFGLIAEEVDEIAPDLVSRNAAGQVQTVRYDQVNAMLLNEFLKEHRKVEDQQQQIDALNAKVEEISRLLEQLQPARASESDTVATGSPARTRKPRSVN